MRWGGGGAGGEGVVGERTGDLSLTERDGHINMKSYWGSMRQSTYRLHLLAILITFPRSSLTDIRLQRDTPERWGRDGKK